MLARRNGRCATSRPAGWGRLSSSTPRGCSSAGRALRSQRRSRRFESAHLHPLFCIFAPFGRTVLGFRAVSWHSHWVVHRVYRPDYRLLITLPYAALRRLSGRRTGSTLGFRLGSRRPAPKSRLVPYAALPQRRAVPYSARWARSRPLTALSRAREGHSCGVAGPEVHWIHGARLLTPSSSSVSTMIPLGASRSAMVRPAASSTWIRGGAGRSSG